MSSENPQTTEILKTKAEWLANRKREAARRLTAQNLAEAEAARHRNKIRRFVGLQNAVRARRATPEFPAARRGTIVRVWGRTMAEVVWEPISGDGRPAETSMANDAPGQTWQLSDLEVAE